MMGSIEVDHWTSGTVYECSEIAGSPQGSPPAADYVGCEAERGPAASVKPGQKSCVRSSGIITLSGLSHCQHDALVTVRDEARLRRGHNDQSRRGHQCSETTLT
jgi:hypothetical protein